MNNLKFNKIYLKFQTKLRIFNTKAKAVLLYGCESWKNSKCITAKLQVFINKCPRKILRIFWLDQIINGDFYIHGFVHRDSNLIIVQQDATFSVYYISVGGSTCFGR